VSTTLFTVIQNSLNQLWSLRLKGEQHLRMALRNRLRALVIILSSGILFLAFLVIDASQAFINEHYEFYNKDLGLLLIEVVHRLLGIVVETAWFAIIFRYLPFGHMPNRAIWVGAAVTAVLFLLGKRSLATALGNRGRGSP